MTVINLHKSMGPGRDGTHDLWIGSQTVARHVTVTDWAKWPV